MIWLVELEWNHKLLFISEGMSKVAAMTIRTRISSKDHSTDLSLVARVTNDRTKFIDAMSILAMISIRAGPSLLPFVA